MTKPLDGIALQAYFRRLGFPQETQELLIHIRNSPPSRTPGARHGNMPVWYPSKKMRCIIKAESAKVEFAFLLAAEHDDAILEVWDPRDTQRDESKQAIRGATTFSRRRKTAKCRGKKRSRAI